MARSALIAGLGLIGGSAGMALHAAGWRVSYLDPHVSEAEACERRAADGLGSWDGGDDLVILAAPVNVALDQLRGQAGRSRGVVTSVCSVMRPLRAAAGDVTFIAGHPLAGSEKRGLAAARADLFEGKKWFVDGDDEAVEALIHDCGARRIRVTAEEHDAALALTSHLPQLLSTALGAALTEGDVDRFAGAGLETFLRLAGSDSSVWAPILEANRDNIRAHFDRVVAIAETLIDADPAEAFRRANAIADSLDRKSPIR